MRQLRGADLRGREARGARGVGRLQLHAPGGGQSRAADPRRDRDAVPRVRACAPLPVPRREVPRTRGGRGRFRGAALAADGELGVRSRGAQAVCRALPFERGDSEIPRRQTAPQRTFQPGFHGHRADRRVAFGHGHPLDHRIRAVRPDGLRAQGPDRKTRADPAEIFFRDTNAFFILYNSMLIGQSDLL